MNFVIDEGVASNRNTKSKRKSNQRILNISSNNFIPAIVGTQSKNISSYYISPQLYSNQGSKDVSPSGIKSNTKNIIFTGPVL